jgi:fermentation-respiration switch protein FrsA (DUF1100 family)
MTGMCAGMPPILEALRPESRTRSRATYGAIDAGGDRLLYYGESLGAAVVVELATEHPPAALVLRSPFVDLAAVGQVHLPFLPVPMLLRDRFPLVDHLQAVQSPVTVVYGTSDTIVPPSKAAGSPPPPHPR